MKQKFISLFVALCIALAMIVVLPDTTYAQSSGFYTYTVSNGEATITECSTSVSGELIIPDYIGKYPVVAIASRAFQGCENLTTITISDNIRSIGDLAFNKCFSLTNIYVSEQNPMYESVEGVLFNEGKTILICYPGGNLATSYAIPESVTTIGFAAFNYCVNLTEINIGRNVEIIGDYAFIECLGITEIVIPNSVVTIGDGAFQVCRNLQKIDISDSVTSIGDYSFQNCDNLIDVSIGSKVANIGNRAFFRCEKMTNITIPGTVKHIGDSAFEECKALNDVDIQYGVMEIGEYAFKDCTQLHKISLVDSIESIGIGAFKNCYSLTEITLPIGLTRICDYTFHCCSGLKSLIIPNGVTSIGDLAIGNCSFLTYIVIPDSVTNIGDYAFNYCNSVTDVYYTGTKTEWDNISVGDFENCLVNAKIHYNFGPRVVTYNANGGYDAPESQTGIGMIKLSEEIPKKLGYTFLGWSTSPDVEINLYQPGDSFTSVYEDNMLYAVWERTSYVTVKKLPVSGQTLLAVSTTGIPADSQIVLSCYQGDKLSYVEPITKLAGQDAYYFIPAGDYTTAKVMVFENFDTIVPIIEPVFVE